MGLQHQEDTQFAPSRGEESGQAIGRGPRWCDYQTCTEEGAMMDLFSKEIGISGRGAGIRLKAQDRFTPFISSWFDNGVKEACI